MSNDVHTLKRDDVISTCSSLSPCGGTVVKLAMWNPIAGGLRSQISKKVPTKWFIPKRKLTKFGRKKKGAKTLVIIVLGLFIHCFFPFFVTNVAASVCRKCAFKASLWKYTPTNIDIEDGTAPSPATAQKIASSPSKSLIVFFESHTFINSC